MATPMTPAQWRSQLKKFDVPFWEHPNFEDPNSGRDDETGKIFGPVYGGIQHHTGDDAPDLADRKVIVNGRTGLPGPLSQAGLRDDGVIELITWKRANHAGGGDPDVLRAVRNESYKDYPPPTDKHEGEAGAVDGNDAFYGLEAYYSGSHAMTKAQYKSAVGFWAAVCDFHGWSAKSIIGHKEWSDYKVDPGFIDMKVFRADIDARIAAVNKKTVVEPVGPVRPTPNITEAIARNIKYEKVLRKVTAKTAQGFIDVARAELKQQRRALRDMERKAS